MATEHPELRTDPARCDQPETGIYVRAYNGSAWSAVDIMHLDKPSLLAWLRSRGGENEWAENVVGVLLGHGNLHQGD